MKIFKAKYFFYAVIILSLAGLGYYYRDEVGRVWRQFVNRSLPCQQPITYSIGNVDPRFNLSKGQVLAFVQKAIKIWEDPVGKKLFAYSPTGDLKIDFIYDDRQKATDALKKIGITLSDDKATFNALKIKYDQMSAAYRQDKARIDALVAAYNADKAAYEKDVADWNNRGGAPKDVFDALEARRLALNDRLAAINDAENALNASIDIMNSTAAVLNKLIGALNLQVTKYNTVGASNGQQYNEGVYTNDAGGTRIDIYQFNDTNQLVRLFAHELGHALGLEHLANPKAIMYYLNEGSNEKLTADDLAALKSVCRIQ